jgi:hypothetical protein
MVTSTSNAAPSFDRTGAAIEATSGSARIRVVTVAAARWAAASSSGPLGEVISTSSVAGFATLASCITWAA